MALLTVIAAFGDSVLPMFINKTKFLKNEGWPSNHYFRAMIV
jgi:hypothetical protein